MTDNLSETERRLLDPGAARAFQALVGELREMLLAEAAKHAPQDRITEADLVEARFPDKDSIQFADAQAIISRALRENRVIEWVSYGMAVVLFLFGLILLAVGVFTADIASRVGCFSAGSIVELLILIPFRFAVIQRSLLRS